MRKPLAGKRAFYAMGQRTYYKYKLMCFNVTHLIYPGMPSWARKAFMIGYEDARWGDKK